MLPLASTPRSKMGAFLMPSRGIEMYATTWLGPAPGLLVLGRNLGGWWGGDSGSLRAGFGWVATWGEPRRTSPLVGGAVAIRPKPSARRRPRIHLLRSLASLDVTRRERADRGEAHAHPTGAGRDGRLEGVLDGPAKVRFLDLVTLLGEILVHQADERRRGPFLGFRHRVLRLVNPLGQSPVVGCKRAGGRKRALFRRNCQKMCRDARTAV